jgi:ribosomal-protein-alanine N-acetyltransferase
VTEQKADPIDPRYLSLLWAGPERTGEITALHARLFDPPWSALSIAATLEHPGSTALVALLGQPRELGGFVLGQLAADEAELLSIGVAPEWQCRGLGRQLVQALARAVKRAEAKRLFLEVAADNDAAFALYRGLGFVEVGRRKGYYQRRSGPPVDALNLALAL